MGERGRREGGARYLYIVPAYFVNLLKKCCFRDTHEGERRRVRVWRGWAGGGRERGEGQGEGEGHICIYMAPAYFVYLLKKCCFREVHPGERGGRGRGREAWGKGVGGREGEGHIYLCMAPAYFVYLLKNYCFGEVHPGEMEEGATGRGGGRGVRDGLVEGGRGGEGRGPVRGPCLLRLSAEEGLLQGGASR